ncbi:MAG: ATP-dependent RecD-like DNA helicase [Bacilli bacterium]|nr:ATP-dependent RecD-like DNA helicase [Bacilli bacterium]
MKNYIKGNFKKSIFSSDTGYVIGLFKLKETNDKLLQEQINHTITFTGYFHELNEDDTYIMYGEVIDHPKYGIQFQSNSYERVKPTDKDTIAIFLASDLFKGVGEKLAKSIAETLGDETIDKILSDPTCLYAVPKLTKEKANNIANTVKKYEESHQNIAKLIDIGFSMKEALNIYNEYKSNTTKIIETNIYQITYNLPNISFLKIDKAAKNLNIDPKSKQRVKAAVLYIMKELVYHYGDSYLDEDTIIRNTNQFLKIGYENYSEIFKSLEENDYIVINNDEFYLKEIWDAENNITERIYHLASKKTKENKKLPALIEEMEKINKIKYNEQQKKAITKALEDNLLVITGGPGTGKTTIIKAITELYQHINKISNYKVTEKLALLAPTGRASKRMSESTNLPASTIHRFLKWNKELDEFMINENNKSDVELVIVDEVSMIDINLFNSLMKGLKSNVKMILVGDYNQLPSVGPGNLLKDLIQSKCIDTIKLNHLYRQGEDSYIISLAHEIKNGNLTENYLETYKDYTFLKCSDNHIKNNLMNLCQKIIDKGYDYKHMQILAPMYRGKNGIDILNKHLQNVFNPKSKEKREIKSGDVIFREGDKILQLENMPDENIYNGDIGIIKYIKNSSKKNELYIDFDGNLVKFTPKDFNKIKHGYIISIHKSQGSEFDMVIMTMSFDYKRMLYKKLIYTGVTRAKRKLILIGQPDAFAYSVHNNNVYERKSKLLEKIMYRFKKNN